MIEVSSLTCNLKLEFWGGRRKNDLGTVMVYKDDNSLKIIYLEKVHGVRKIDLALPLKHKEE